MYWPSEAEYSKAIDRFYRMRESWYEGCCPEDTEPERCWLCGEDAQPDEPSLTLNGVCAKCVADYTAVNLPVPKRTDRFYLPIAREVMAQQG